MTVGELKQVLDGLDNDTEINTTHIFESEEDGREYESYIYLGEVIANITTKYGMRGESVTFVMRSDS